MPKPAILNPPFSISTKTYLLLSIPKLINNTLYLPVSIGSAIKVNLTFFNINLSKNGFLFTWASSISTFKALHLMIFLATFFGVPIFF